MCLILGDVVFIISLFFVRVFFKKSIKTAVPEDGRPPGALVWTKLIETNRFEVGAGKTFLFFVLRCCVFLGSTEAALIAKISSFPL